MDRSSIEFSSPVIEVEGLRKSVTMADGQGELLILDNVGFSVGKGESVAIVGASGSGKSTLLGLLAGLDVPVGGRVRIQGTDLFALSEDARAALRGESIGFVFQSFQLLPALTALENVMLPLELADADEAEPIARHWLERVGLGSRLRHYPKHLSGGEQQRVALARAFAANPALLLADEPTGNLDTQRSHEIMELLWRLNVDRGITVLMVTHEADMAAYARRMVRFVDGLVASDERNPQPHLPREPLSEGAGHVA